MWYSKPDGEPQTVVVSMRTVILPKLDVTPVTELNSIPKQVCCREQAHLLIDCSSILVGANDHDDILDEIARHDRIEYQREVEMTTPDNLEDSDSDNDE